MAGRSKILHSRLCGHRENSYELDCMIIERGYRKTHIPIYFAMSAVHKAKTAANFPLVLLTNSWSHAYARHFLQFMGAAVGTL